MIAFRLLEKCIFFKLIIEYKNHTLRLVCYCQWLQPIRRCYAGGSPTVQQCSSRTKHFRFNSLSGRITSTGKYTSQVCRCTLTSQVCGCTLTSQVYVYIDITGVWVYINITGVWVFINITGVWVYIDITGVCVCTMTSQVWVYINITGVCVQ